MGVPANFFTVEGALTVTNDENSGVITAVFPRTAGTVNNPAVIDIPAIEGVTAPIIGGILATEINPTPQYTGTIIWSPADNPFKVGVVYTAVITLTAKAGFTFTGVPADFFTVKDAAVTNAAHSNIVMAEFKININSLTDYLSVQPANTADVPYFITLNIKEDDFDELRITLNNNRTKYVNLDLTGSNITGIPDNAFFYGYYDDRCTSLTSVIIPNSVTSIGDYAFDCDDLTAINVDTGNSAYTSDSGVLYDKNKTSLIKYPAKKTDASFTIPDSVTSIGNYTFSYCNLYSVSIPAGVTSIGYGAFTQCYRLTSITIPAGVTSIGYNAFSECHGLTSVTFQGTIPASGFGSTINGEFRSSFDGDLREKYLAGGLGTYTRTNETWTKQ